MLDSKKVKMKNKFNVFNNFNSNKISFLKEKVVNYLSPIKNKFFFNYGDLKSIYFIYNKIN